MKTRIYLARHGETLWNKTLRLQGQLDSELTPLGKLQSLEIAAKLANKDINAIISSPLGRAMQTAYICQEQLQVTHQTSKNLMERNLGDWQGKEVAEIQAFPTYDEMLNQVTSLQINHAESALACGQRIFNTLKQFGNKHLGQNLLFIFHGEALRCLLFLLGKNETTTAFNLYQNGCIITVDFQLKPPYLTIISE